MATVVLAGLSLLALGVKAQGTLAIRSQSGLQCTGSRVHTTTFENVDTNTIYCGRNDVPSFVSALQLSVSEDAVGQWGLSVGDSNCGPEDGDTSSGSFFGTLLQAILYTLTLLNFSRSWAWSDDLHPN